ncbi:hypothetical protein E3A20_30150, partial [Planctomyces bekefii]
RNSENLTVIIDDILDFSKIEANKIEYEKLRISVASLVHDVHTLFLPKAQEKQIEFTVVAEGLVPETIVSDPVRLKQILINIIGNAIKFTQMGRVSVVVHLIAAGKTAELNALAFDVNDTGIGISVDQQDRLFKPFSQADSSTSRKYGGTGLGLELSKRLALGLGGDLQMLFSAPGKGSLFRVQVPIGSIQSSRLIHDLDASPAPRSRAANLYGEALKGIRVLLAEDSPDNQVLISRLLRAQCAEVVIVNNGEEAIPRAIREKFDVILMDLQMPILDGFEATKRLRAMGCQTPIVALSAHAMKEEMDRSIQSGCNDHLTKPIDPQVLVQKLAFYAGSNER